ncbi:unnamed protein product [Dibothriocephalus latus]|uniref:Uncharacterized protein n=1 Tax=Dibothriocephalus latus TaxID=60516 RepID=A0A3P7MR17_DIBLA|nr:unnamed protein product [Dibothriocephalus latus]
MRTESNILLLLLLLLRARFTFLFHLNTWGQHFCLYILKVLWSTTSHLGLSSNNSRAVLFYDTKFNTRDARPVDFIVSFESTLQKCEANEESKNVMRQKCQLFAFPTNL